MERLCLRSSPAGRDHLRPRTGGDRTADHPRGRGRRQRPRAWLWISVEMILVNGSCSSDGRASGDRAVGRGDRRSGGRARAGLAGPSASSVVRALGAHGEKPSWTRPRTECVDPLSGGLIGTGLSPGRTSRTPSKPWWAPTGTVGCCSAEPHGREAVPTSHKPGKQAWSISSNTPARQSWPMLAIRAWVHKPAGASSPRRTESSGKTRQPSTKNTPLASGNPTPAGVSASSTASLT